MSEIPLKERAERRQPTHIIRLEKPRPRNLIAGERPVAFTEDPAIRGGFIADAAKFPGGNTPGVYRFLPGSEAFDVAKTVTDPANEGKSFVTRGAASSLTGAVVPMGEVVLSMEAQKDISDVVETAEGKKLVTIEPGVTLRELDTKLKKDGLFLPSAPTYQDATVIGAISTDGKGARSYKYGGTRKFVHSLEMVLASGEVLNVTRGQYLAHPPDEESPGGYFLLQPTEGESARKISLPTYTMPDVPKISAGYPSKPFDQEKPYDLIDLIAGSEGSLGVITKATVEVVPEPPTGMALIACENDVQAFNLIKHLREQEADKRESGEPGGISAVEFIGENALGLIRGDGKTKDDLSHPLLGDAKALLLIQVETPDGSDSLEQLFDSAGKVGITDFFYAEPDDGKTKDKFIEIREDVPKTVNELVGRMGTTKVGADPCVRPEDLQVCDEIYTRIAAETGLIKYTWGHGEGNMHTNFIPRTKAEIQAAKDAVLAAGTEVIRDLGGVGTAEHGVGKNEVKKKLLLELYGEDGVAQMRAIKLAFDPDGRMAPQNIFDLAA